MGIFYEMVKVVNLAPVPINVRFDGQDMTIEPGEAMLPRVAVVFAKNQNPVMGTQSASNPSITGAKYLIGVVGTRDRITPLTREEWAAHVANPSRLNINEFASQRLGRKERFEVHGEGPIQARSSWDEGVRTGGAGQLETDAV